VVIRGGRLRMRDSRADQKLQAAVRWAAGLDLKVVPGRGALPIIVDRGEGSPMSVFWVIVESGMILFSLGEPGLNIQRLGAAAVVFGLSPAQAEVARHVADGLSLPEIAGKMEITANTARTHLNRVYEKVGVRTQPALVRVLLSAAAPI
jgi:DNA-binding CsgD family transcriptional regulator